MNSAKKTRGRPRIKDCDRAKKFTVTVSAANHAAAKRLGLPVSAMLNAAISRKAKAMEGPKRGD